MQKKQIKYMFAFVLTIFIFFLQSVFDRIGWRTASIFDYSIIDNDGLFMMVSVHHIVQAILALLVIFILYKTKGYVDFKLKPKFDIVGIKYTIFFCVATIIYYIIVYIIGSKINSIGVYDYELNTANVVGTLGFQLLLSGTSEEILFRSLPIVLYKKVFNIGKKSDDVLAVVLTSVLFAIGHFNRNLSISIQWFQIVYAFVWGLIFGFVFIKSKSVIYPMIIHGMSNLISVGGCYLYMSLV